jgi:hypothetical protein
MKGNAIMSHNNEKWYTFFTRNTFTNEWEVLAQVKGEGNANLMITALRPYYSTEDRKIGTLEGRYTKVTDELKHKYFS